MSQAFRCDALDTPQAYIWNKKNFPKNWAVEIKGLGPNSPFWVPGDPLGAWYQAKKCRDPMFNLRRPLGCSWDQIWPIGALRGPWGPPMSESFEVLNQQFITIEFDILAPLCRIAFSNILHSDDGFTESRHIHIFLHKNIFSPTHNSEQNQHYHLVIFFKAGFLAVMHQ